MHKKFKLMRWFLSLTLIFSFLFLGCAKLREDISYVQPNVVDKEIFKGTWYYRPTIIESPYVAWFAFEGEQPFFPLGVDKIKWVIEENYLLAYRTYEWLGGADMKEETESSGQEYYGAPVLAYRIISHFDIQRDYNPTTGEETNVIVENGSDRIWYKTRYMRVDWSEPIINSMDVLMIAKAFGEVQLSPVSYYVQDPADPDYPEITGDYIDIVNKVFVEPEMRYVDYYGSSIPACFFYFSTSDCAGQVIKVRNSFLKVDETKYNAYEPLKYDDRWMDWFGYFDTDKKTYNREYGVTNSGRYRLANRWNIWKNAMSDVAVPDKDKSIEEKNYICESKVGKGSVYNPIFQKCSIPFKDREVNPIVYFLNPDFPREGENSLLDVTVKLVNDWNKVFKEAVYCAQNPEECEKTPSPLSEDKLKNIPDVFVLCPNNPVKADDPAYCGERGIKTYCMDKNGRFNYHQALETEEDKNKCLDDGGRLIEKDLGLRKRGDLRYSFIDWIDSPHSYSPLGYGPSSPDPETGQIISATANIYGAEIDWYATYIRDIIRLLNGEISSEEFIKGENVQAWINCMNYGDCGKSFTNTYTTKQLLDTAKGMDQKSLSAVPSDSRVSLKGKFHIDKNYLQRRTEEVYKSGVLGDGSDIMSIRRSLISGTPIEKMMINNHILMFAGFEPNTPITDDIASKLSPLKLASRPEMDKLLKLEKTLLKNTVTPSDYLIDFADDYIVGLAREFKGKDPQEVWRTIRQRSYYGTTLHEVGHTLGLRHNFEASFDAFNYAKEYWELRAKGSNIATVTQNDYPSYMNWEEVQKENEEYIKNYPDCVGKGIQPRYKCPMTSVEKYNKQQEYQYPSIMDYGGKIDSEYYGLGSYDRAAIKFGYTQLVEVMEGLDDDQALIVETISVLTEWGWPVPLKVTADGYIAVDPKTGSPLTIPYISYLDELGKGDLEKGIDLLVNHRVTVPFSKLPDNSNPKIWGDDAYTKAVYYYDCKDPDLDTNKDGKCVMPRVPYKFNGDEFEGSSLSTRVFDVGADYFEIMDNMAQEYANYYLLRNFHRDRYGFFAYNPYRYMARIYDRYFSYTRDLNQYYVLFRYDLKDFGDLFFASDYGLGSFTAANNTGFNLLCNVLAWPEPGLYQRGTSSDGSTQIFYRQAYSEPNPEATFNINLVEGRYFETTFNSDSGYFWFENFERIGSFYDKWLALESLTDSMTYFMNKDTSYDVRLYSINFYNSYPRQLNNLFAGIFSQEWGRYAPYFEKEEGGNKYYPKFQNYITLTDGDFIDPDKDGIPGPVIDPVNSFSVRFYAAIYALAGFPSIFNRIFLDYSRIYIEGQEDGINPPITNPIKFTDPFSGKTYIAQSFKNEKGNEMGGGAVMLNKAQKLLDKYLKVSGGEYPDYNSINCDTGNAALNTACINLQDMIEELDIMVYLSKLFTYTEESPDYSITRW